MATGGGFRGVSAGQDARFSNKEKKMLAKMKFPAELSVKIDPKKVNWNVMKEWIAKRVTALLGGLEEEVLIGLIYNYLEVPELDAKQLHVTLTPFLEKNTSLFMKELWTMLASANQTASHIPQQLLDAEAAKQQALLKAQQTIQAHVDKTRLESKAAASKLDPAEKEQLPGPPPMLPSSDGPSASRQQDANGKNSSRIDKEGNRDYDRRAGRDRERGDFDRDRIREQDRSFNDGRRDRDYDRDTRGRDRDFYRGRERERERRPRSGSRSQSPPRGGRGASRSPARRHRSRSPAVRDRVVTKKGRSRSASPEGRRGHEAVARGRHIRPSEHHDEPPSSSSEDEKAKKNKKSQHKKGRKSSKKSKKSSRHSASPAGSGDDSGDDIDKKGKKGHKGSDDGGSEEDPDLLALRKKALEAARSLPKS